MIDVTKPKVRHIETDRKIAFGTDLILHVKPYTCFAARPERKPDFRIPDLEEQFVLTRKIDAQMIDRQIDRLLVAEGTGVKLFVRDHLCFVRVGRNNNGVRILRDIFIARRSTHCAVLLVDDLPLRVEAAEHLMEDVALGRILDHLGTARHDVARKLDDLALHRIDVIEQVRLASHRANYLAAFESDGYHRARLRFTSTTEFKISDFAGSIGIYTSTHKENVEWLYPIVTNWSAKDVDILNVEVL